MRLGPRAALELRSLCESTDLIQRLDLSEKIRPRSLSSDHTWSKMRQNTEKSRRPEPYPRASKAEFFQLLCIEFFTFPSSNFFQQMRLRAVNLITNTSLDPELYVIEKTFTVWIRLVQPLQEGKHLNVSNKHEYFCASHHRIFLVLNT